MPTMTPPGTLRRTRHAIAAALCLSGLQCSEPESALPEVPELPPIAVSSKYIDYSSTGDTSRLCLDDTLARADRFIEASAAYLEVEPPSGRIRHVQVTGVEFGNKATYPCDGTFACYQYYESEDLGLVQAMTPVHQHELAHAVDIPVLGRGHSTLVEGLASYLSASNFVTHDDVTEFPARFKAMVARAPKPDDYNLAMQFVGSLLLRPGGLADYKRLREAMPNDSGLDEFAEVFAEVYGTSLDTALAEMHEPVSGRYIPDGCPGNEAIDIPHITWNSEGIAEATLHGQCGDPLFLTVPTGTGYSLTIDVPKAGTYKQTVTGPGAAQVQVDLLSCPELGGYPGYGGPAGKFVDVWRPGRHRLMVGYPPGTDATAELQFRLEYDGPSP